MVWEVDVHHDAESQARVALKTEHVWNGVEVVTAPLSALSAAVSAPLPDLTALAESEAPPEW